MNDATKKKAINHFFQLNRTNTHVCHAPGVRCTKPAIRAHSIPNAYVLEALAYDGYVIMPCQHLHYPQPTTNSFDRISRNRASTFTGLCRTHDNYIFSSIDDCLLDYQNEEHLFLLAYRAVMREYHVALQNAIRFQSSYLNMIKLGQASGNEPSKYGDFATSHIVNAIKTQIYKKIFDVAYSGCDWSALEHRVLHFKNQTPTIAMSSLFSLDDLTVDETPHVALTVFPVRSDVIVVFSAIQIDAPFVFPYFERLFSAKGDYQKYLLSKTVLQSGDNFVLSLKFYDQLPEESKDAITTFYTETSFVNKRNHEDKRLYLF